MSSVILLHQITLIQPKSRCRTLRRRFRDRAIWALWAAPAGLPCPHLIGRKALPTLVLSGSLLLSAKGYHPL